VTGTKKIDTRGFANTPVRLPADVKTILDYIDKRK
jgi:hypothetical protein